MFILFLFIALYPVSSFACVNYLSVPDAQALIDGVAPAESFIKCEQKDPACLCVDKIAPEEAKIIDDKDGNSLGKKYVIDDAKKRARDIAIAKERKDQIDRAKAILAIRERLKAGTATQADINLALQEILEYLISKR